MRSIPILMPQLGESIAEATVVKVLIAPGAKVEAEQDIFEVETNKATMSIIAPASGTVGTVNAQIGTSYAVGAALASLQISEADARALGLNDAPPEAPRVEKTDKAETKDVVHFAVNEADTIYHKQPTVEPVVGGLPVPAGAAGASYIACRWRTLSSFCAAWSSIT